MTEAVDHHIPVSLVVSRLENHRDQLQRDLAVTPWWRWRRRLLLSGAIGAYDYEIQQVLEISGSWQPIWRRFGANNTTKGD